MDVLDALVGVPGGSPYDDPLETALDHLYLAASALRHRPAGTGTASPPPAPGTPETGLPPG